MDPQAPKRILVTGASGAVGYATCDLLAARGHRVAGTMRSRRGKNTERADALEALGVAVVEMDVTDEASVDAGVTAAVAALGGLDAVTPASTSTTPGSALTASKNSSAQTRCTASSTSTSTASSA